MNEIAKGTLFKANNYPDIVVKIEGIFLDDCPDKTIVIVKYQSTQRIVSYTLPYFREQFTFA